MLKFHKKVNKSDDIRMYKKKTDIYSSLGNSYEDLNEIKYYPYIRHHNYGDIYDYLSSCEHRFYDEENRYE